MVRRIEGPEWLRPGDVASLFGVSTEQIRAWEKDLLFPSAEGGSLRRNSRRWRKETIERVLNEGGLPLTSSPERPNWGINAVTMFDDDDDEQDAL